MARSNKRLAQKAVAVIVIVTLLDLIGVSPVIVLFMTGVAVVVWLVGRKSESNQVEKIFEFYISADAILRDSGRQWYGFEIAELIENGESALSMMPDCPPLHYFALGALYHHIGNYEATDQYLSRLQEDERYDERNHSHPSPQLRRYVEMLRRIESEPSIAPQALGAVRSLERARRTRAAQLLAESRQFLHANSPRPAGCEVTQDDPVPAETAFAASRPISAISTPPPITEVLQDIYRDEQSN